LALGTAQDDTESSSDETEDASGDQESESEAGSSSPPPKKQRKCARHSPETRKLAIDFISNQGFTFRRASGSLTVPLGTLHRWIDEYLSIGKMAADPRGGSISGGKSLKMTEQLLEDAKGFLRKKSTYTLKELQAKLADKRPGVDIPSPSTIGRHLKRAGFTYKCVTVVPCERNKPEAIEARERFAMKWLARDEDFRMAIWIDECGWNLSKRRNRGRAILGQRAYVVLPGNRGANITLFAAVSASNGLMNHQTWLGGTKTDTFIAALQRMFEALKMQDLANYSATHGGVAPADPSAAHVRRLIIMDNCPIHKPQAVRKCIEDAGYEVLYEPPWSPFLNPIEEAFALWKKAVNTELTRDKNTFSIVECISRAAPLITAEKVAAFWRHSRLFIGPCLQGKPIGASAISAEELANFEVTWKFAQEEAAAYHAVHPARKRGRPPRSKGASPDAAGPSNPLVPPPAADENEEDEDEDVYRE
jgi:transposase